MPLYCSTYVGDTAHLNAAQSGAYLHLIMYYWMRGGLPNDDAQLARIAKMTDKEWARSRATIGAFFKDGWKHNRIEKELKEAEEAYQKRANAGRKGGIAGAKHEHGLSNASPGLKQLQPPLELPSSLRSEDNEKTQDKNRDEEFGRFLAACAKPTDQDDARRLFDQILDDGRATAAQLIEGAARHKREEAGKDPQFIKSPKSWLKAGGWKDGIIPGQAQPPAPNQTFVRQTDPRWADLSARYRIAKGKSPPDVNGGWHFPNEWLVGDQEHAA